MKFNLFTNRSFYRRLWFRQSGFTLIEMIISLAIFAVVAVIAVGALVRVVGANRRAQSMQTATNSLEFTLEIIGRDLRVASKINCATGAAAALNGTWASHATPSSCGITGEASNIMITFQSSKIGLPSGGGTPCRLLMAYSFINAPALNIIKTQQQYCDDTNYLVTPPNSLLPINLTLTAYRAAVYNSGVPGKYALVFLRMVGVAGAKVQDQTNFNVQTAISQRIHD